MEYLPAIAELVKLSLLAAVLVALVLHLGKHLLATERKVDMIVRWLARDRARRPPPPEGEDDADPR